MLKLLAVLGLLAMSAQAVDDYKLGPDSQFKADVSDLAVTVTVAVAFGLAG